MKYDFTSILNRKGDDAAAVDVVGVLPPEMGAPSAPKAGFNYIPMSVADMNFPACPTIPEAIIQRAQKPHYGYFLPRKEYFDAIIQWQEKRNKVTGLTPSCIGYENGVHGGNVTALRVFCAPGDKVLLHTPAYASFINNLKDLGYNAILSPLVQDDQGVWRMDFEDMEKKIREGHIHAAIFCSPHNPLGRVWERWEIEKMMELYRKYDVYVVSDEIWSDLVFPGYQHIPTQSVSEDARNRTIAMYAPSKTFNLAGLVGSYHIIYNPTLQDKMARQTALTHYNNMNVLSMWALIGAYTPEGHEWVDELCQVLQGNAEYAVGYIRDHFEGVKVSMPQGTYMIFLDCTQWCAEHGKTLPQLRDMGYDVGVGWQDGRPFAGPCHLRMNLAVPLSRVKEAFDRLDKYVFNA